MNRPAGSRARSTSGSWPSSNGWDPAGMHTRQRPEADRTRTSIGHWSPAAPLTRWSFPALLGGLALYGAAALGLAAIGGWLGIAAVFCLAALLLAVIVAAS